MALNPHLSLSARNSALAAVPTAIGTSGFLRFYDGTQPATADTALSGNTLLAQLALSATSFPAASAGTITANAITGANASATGTCTFASLTTSAGVRVLDLSVGTSASDIIVNTTAFSSGVAVSCSSLTYSIAA